MNAHNSIMEIATDLRFDEIRIENTNHCSYTCFFCPRDKLSRNKGFMPISDLEKILSQVPGFAGQVDLHGFGEPLLDKKLDDKIKLVKLHWPKSKSRIYTTLGVTLNNSQKKNLIESGLNTIEVSFYGFNRQSYLETHGIDRFEIARKNLFDLCLIKYQSGSEIKINIRDFPDHDDVKQPGLSNEAFNSFKQWLVDIGVSEIHGRKLHNYGDGRGYNEAPDKGVCSIAWGYRKRVLQITWDLNVIPCCFDFNATMVLGSLHNSSISEIFQGEAYRTLITAHEKNDLQNYKVCLNCERCFMA